MSWRISRQFRRVSGPHVPSFRINRFLSTVRIWSSTTLPCFPLNLPYSPPFRREALSGPVAGVFCDRARRKRSRSYGEDVRPSETPQTRGLAVPQ